MDEFKMRVVAMCSGGDWCDASVEHIQVPHDMNLDEMKTEYLKKYGYLARQESGIQHISFTVWLMHHGCKVDDTVEEFFDD